MVRVAVIDSGVHAAHPHIRGVAGGISFGGPDPADYTDRLGHGTAVMAAIQEKAPDAECWALRVFQTSLRTRIEHLVEALEWCLVHEMHVVNLSLGTANPDHRDRFQPLIARAVEQGLVLVSAAEVEGRPALPGSLEGVIGVRLDPECPRDAYRKDPNGGFLTSGLPRPIPGVAIERNLQGISFAVANMSGFVARAYPGRC